MPDTTLYIVVLGYSMVKLTRRGVGARKILDVFSDVVLNVKCCPSGRAVKPGVGAQYHVMGFVAFMGLVDDE